LRKIEVGRRGALVVVVVPAAAGSKQHVNLNATIIGVQGMVPSPRVVWFLEEDETSDEINLGTTAGFPDSLSYDRTESLGGRLLHRLTYEGVLPNGVLHLIGFTDEAHQETILKIHLDLGIWNE
jgi:hypothetical protein